MSERFDRHDDAPAHQAVIERLWTQPLLDAYVDRLPTPSGSSVLVAESRGGYVPLRWSERLREETRIIALDPDGGMLDFARQRMGEELQRRIFFVPQKLEKLSYADDVFAACVCVQGLSTTQELGQGLSELARVTQPGGGIMVAAPLWDCFPEVYDMLDEAIKAHQLLDAARRIEELRGSFVREEDALRLARESNLHNITLERMNWELTFESGRELLLSPLIRETFLTHWIGQIRSSDREPVLRYIADAIDTYFHERMFTCQVKAVCLFGERS